jgi:hypothetical protein
MLSPRREKDSGNSQHKTQGELRKKQYQLASSNQRQSLFSATEKFYREVKGREADYNNEVSTTEQRIDIEFQDAVDEAKNRAMETEISYAKETPRLEYESSSEEDINADDYVEPQSHTEAFSFFLEKMEQQKNHCLLDIQSKLNETSDLIQATNNPSDFLKTLYENTKEAEDKIEDIKNIEARDQATYFFLLAWQRVILHKILDLQSIASRRDSKIISKWMIKSIQNDTQVDHIVVKLRIRINWMDLRERKFLLELAFSLGDKDNPSFQNLVAWLCCSVTKRINSLRWITLFLAQNSRERNKYIDDECEVRDNYCKTIIQKSVFEILNSYE